MKNPLVHMYKYFWFKRAAEGKLKGIVDLMKYIIK